jgi:hypothetical protein
MSRKSTHQPLLSRSVPQSATPGDDSLDPIEDIDSDAPPPFRPAGLIRIQPSSFSSLSTDSIDSDSNALRPAVAVQPEGDAEPIDSDWETPEEPPHKAAVEIPSDSESISSGSGDPPPPAQEDADADPISETNAYESVREEETIDSNPGEFFQQKRVVFELRGNEDCLELWDCGYSRVLRAAVVESEIEGFEDGVYQLIVKARDVPHVKDPGDQFVMGEPFHAFSYQGEVYLLAPNVSDKC